MNLLSFIESAGLTNVLDSDGPFTVFAPLDEAFLKLPEELQNTLGSDPEALRDLLLGHVVMGKAIKARDLVDEDVQVNSAQGSPLRVNVYLKSRFYSVTHSKPIFIGKMLSDIICRDL